MMLWLFYGEKHVGMPPGSLIRPTTFVSCHLLQASVSSQQSEWAKSCLECEIPSLYKKGEHVDMWVFQRELKISLMPSCSFVRPSAASMPWKQTGGELNILDCQTHTLIWYLIDSKQTWKTLQKTRWRDYRPPPSHCSKTCLFHQETFLSAHWNATEQ